MPRSVTTIPVFALDPATDWDEDFLNAMDASLQYQSTVRGSVLPVFAFSPMTAPANPDTWEPLPSSPENLLIVSVERSWDAKLLQALDRARRVVGTVMHNADDSAVHLDQLVPIADVYQQMEEAEV